MKYPKKINLEKAKSFFKKKKKLFRILNNFYKSKKNLNPNYLDLYAIFQIIIKNRRTTILEFGSGCSTLVIAEALDALKKKFSSKIKKIRRENPFELFYIENEKKYLEFTKNNLRKDNRKIKVNSFFSDVVMTKYNGHFATEYKNLPICNPDLIYLDGPGPSKVKKQINNFTISKNKDLCPMSCDILKFEFFLLPGTIIIVDGRAQNARFLKSNFKRKWLYKYNEYYDQHYFYLKEKYLGPINKKQMKFYGYKSF